MAVAPDGTVLPCQSWLSGPGLGNLLRTPWHRIWNNSDCCAIRNTSAAMEQRCQLGGYAPAGGLLMIQIRLGRRLAMLLAALLLCLTAALTVHAADDALAPPRRTRGYGLYPGLHRDGGSA